jgi:hypothetical protein
MEDSCENHEIIKVGDRVRYLPTGVIFTVKEIYCDGSVGKFKLPAGIQKYRRPVVIPENYAGHYPVNNELAKICPICGKEILQEDLENTKGLANILRLE